MSSIILPQELIERVVDHVSELEDATSLRSCALVSLAFVFPAQKHLFRHIDLDVRIPRKESHRRFHKLLIANPHLGTHVRELRIGDDNEDDSWGGGGKSWILKKSTLAQTLGLLPKLEAFSLTFNSEVTSWKRIPSETQTALSLLIQLPALKAVSLEFINELPPTILHSLTRLQHLSMSWVDIDCHGLSANKLFKSATPAEPQLQSLFLRGTSPLTILTVANIICDSDTSPKLSKLSVSPNFEHGFSDAIGALLKSCGENITNFEWLPSIHFLSPIGTIGLGGLLHLHALRCNVSFRRPSFTAPEGPFSEIKKVLSQLVESPPPSGTKLRTVVLDCHCISDTQLDDAKFLDAWNSLDVLLANSSFADLQEVRVRLSTGTITRQERNKFALTFAGLLPLVKAKGIRCGVHCFDEVEVRSLLLSSRTEVQ